MKYNRFEDLPVWRAAIEFAVRVYALTAKDEFNGYGGLTDQLERAAVSISNNIAEGFERGTTQELLTFIYISRGSAGEARSMLLFLDLLPDFAQLKSDIPNLKTVRYQHFKAAGRLGELTPKLSDKGPALPNSKDTPGFPGRSRARRIPRRVAKDARSQGHRCASPAPPGDKKATG